MAADALLETAATADEAELLTTAEPWLAAAASRADVVPSSPPVPAATEGALADETDEALDV